MRTLIFKINVQEKLMLIDILACKNNLNNSNHVIMNLTVKFIDWQFRTEAKTLTTNFNS